MKKYLKGLLIIVVCVSLIFIMVRDLIVKPFNDGYEQAGIAGGLFTVFIYLLIAAGFYALVSWAID